MCGIVGYIGQQEAQPILLQGLLKLEYRGYDSAGIATLHPANTNKHFVTSIKRSVGKIAILENLLEQNPCIGSIGIGHTRWATHGKPSETNAHPHSVDGITLVHNGIIENYRELRDELISHGSEFRSQTDTEVISHLIAFEMSLIHDFEGAFRNALKRLKGAYAVAVIHEKQPDRILCAALNSPLVVGRGHGEFFVASDFPAVLAYTKDFYILEDGDLAAVYRDGVEISNIDGQPQKRELKTLQWSATLAEKSGHTHFMHKEIFEQPSVVADTLLDRLNFLTQKPLLEGVKSSNLNSFDRIVIVACGTSYHSAVVAKYYLEDMAQIPVETELASEFRYRKVAVNQKTLVIGISQSGETADTLAALKYAVKLGAHVLGICNVMDSAIARLCNVNETIASE